MLELSVSSQCLRFYHKNINLQNVHNWCLDAFHLYFNRFKECLEASFSLSILNRKDAYYMYVKAPLLNNYKTTKTATSYLYVPLKYITEFIYAFKFNLYFLLQRIIQFLRRYRDFSVKSKPIISLFQAEIIIFNFTVSIMGFSWIVFYEMTTPYSA